jgi:hypothetical protein
MPGKTRKEDRRRGRNTGTIAAEAALDGSQVAGPLTSQFIRAACSVGARGVGGSADAAAT